MHPEKKVIKISQSWKLSDQLGVCTEGQQCTPGKLLGQLFPWDSAVFLCLFVCFLAKATLKTQMWESQLEVHSGANSYELPLLSLSERKAISAPVKQITFVYNRISDATDWVVWLYFCDRMSTLQKIKITSFESILVSKHCSKLLNALVPSESKPQEGRELACFERHCIIMPGTLYILNTNFISEWCFSTIGVLGTYCICNEKETAVWFPASS